MVLKIILLCGFYGFILLKNINLLYSNPAFRTAKIIKFVDLIGKIYDSLLLSYCFYENSHTFIGISKIKGA